MTALERWYSDLPEVIYAAGEPILTEGEDHGVLLVLVEGAVSVTKGDVQVAVVNAEGAVLGEMAVLLGGPATATVTAVGDCRLHRSDDPQTLLLERPEAAIAIATAVARRLDLIVSYLADLRTQYADRDDHLGVVAEVLSSLLQYRGNTVEPGSEREPDAPY
jgi:CRP/FNR family cyclic AMP-dependent transcriptional regulator